MKRYKDKKRSLIGQVSKGKFGARFLKPKPKLWLANFDKTKTKTKTKPVSYQLDYSANLKP